VRFLFFLFSLVKIPDFQIHGKEHAGTQKYNHCRKDIYVYKLLTKHVYKGSKAPKTEKNYCLGRLE